MSEPLPYTQAEISERLAKLKASILRTEAERPGIRPLPPMDEETAHDLILALGETAAERLLTADEAFLLGQLLASLRMAIEARMLGKRGRYYVISEAQFKEQLERQK